MAKTEISQKIESLEKEIELKKQELKSLEEKYTFKGMYKAVAGRDNLLRELKDNPDLDDVEKFEQGKEVLQNYIDNL